MQNPEILELKNNFRTVFIKNNDVNTLTLQLRGKAGSNYEEKNEIGVAHITEHLSMYEHKDNTSTQKAISDLGGKYIGITSRDDVTFGLRILKDDIDKGVLHLSKIFSAGDFTEQELLVQKNIIKQEIRRYKDIPEKLISRICYKTMYPNQRMAMLNTGNEEDIENINLEQVKLFKNRMYTAENFILVVSGNSEISTVKSLTEKYFSQFPNFGIAKTIDIEKYPELRVFGITNNVWAQSYIKIDYYAFKISEDLKYDAYLLSKIIEVLLIRKIKEELGLVYHINCVTNASANFGTFSIYFASETRNIQKTLEIICSLIKTFTRFINKETIDKVKKMILNEMEFMLEKTSSRASYVGELVLHGRKDQTFVYEINYLKQIDINSVLEVSKEIFDQKPKITFLSNSLDENDILKYWLL